jgi:dTDP-glucose pyrophosphorylase
VKFGAPSSILDSPLSIFGRPAGLFAPLAGAFACTSAPVCRQFLIPGQFAAQARFAIGLPLSILCRLGTHRRFFWTRLRTCIRALFHFSKLGSGRDIGYEEKPASRTFSFFARRHPCSLMRMKAVILAAGKGTRMKDLTQEIPKPMLKVQGKPILEHILEGILATGIHDVFIVTGWQAEAIESYFGDGSKWHARIAYGRQEVQDGTGKAPELAKQFLGSAPFLLTYGDILVKPETYQQMLDRYNTGYFSGLITVTPGQDVTKGGLNFFDEKFCLKRIVEKPDAEQLKQLRSEGWLKEGQPVWYNAGIYIFKPSLFEFTARLKKSSRGEYELTDAINGLLATHRTIAGLEIQGRWVDVRDPEVLAGLQG